MAQETKVRVRLDTEQAKADLAALNREGERAAEETSASFGASLLGKGIKGVAAGAAAAGIYQLAKPTVGGLGDLLGESLGGVGANLAQFIFGDLDEKARAAQRAREETKDAFAMIAGARGSIPPEARSFFNAVSTLRVTEERGKEMFDRDDSFRGPGVGALVDRILSGIGKMIAEAAEAIGNKLLPWNW